MSVEKGHENRAAAFENTNTILGHFKAIVDSSDDAIVGKDLNGIIQSWNIGAEKIFGYKAEEVIGQPITILFPPENVDEEPSILARIRAGQRIDHYETVRKRKDGTLIDISLTVSPVKDNAGNIIGASKIARDITDKKQWENRLVQAHKELEEANRAKDNFLAMLSHELRTPLNPVLLIASDAADDPALPDDVRARFEMILRNVEMEARLIDDLLDLARIRTGKLKLEKKQVNVHDLLANSLSLIHDQARRKNITLIQKLNDPQTTVLGDAVRLQQVFSNVLKNAVKFTPDNGTVTVQSGLRDHEYVINISDTGIGMTPEELDVAFDAFRQGEHSVVPRFGGLGLGLAISKEFVEFHEGRIDAFSKGRGCGSTFTIKLPLLSGRENGQPITQSGAGHGHGAHIFCVPGPTKN